MTMHKSDTAAAGWRSVRDGVTLTPLRMRDGKGTFLMKYEAGSRSPAHRHPGGEEIFVIEGRGRLDDLPIAAGDFIYTTPGDSHVLYAETDVTIHVVLPEAVELLEQFRMVDLS